MITRAVAEGRPVQMADSQFPTHRLHLQGRLTRGRHPQLPGGADDARRARRSAPCQSARPEPVAVPADRLVKLLQTFADQAVIAIENVRLFNETREALEQQTATAEVLRVISESPTDVEPVLDAVAQRALKLCDAAQSVIALVEGGDIRFVAGHGSTATAVGEVIPLDRGLVIGRAIVDRAVVHIDDLAAESEAEFPQGLNMQRRIGHRTTLAVPLLREGEAVGAIAVWRMEVRPFAAKQRELLQTFADQAVIAIQNARLFNETKEALERQKASAEILNVISSSVADTQPVFDKILESCKHLFGSDETAVLLIDEQDEVNLAAYMGALRDEVAATFPAPLEKSAIARAIRERRVAHYPDIVNDTSVTRAVRRIAQQAGYRSMAYAPMLWNERGIGAIGVIRRSGEFTDKELAMLQTFADQAVIAIQNARLFNETKEALEQQTATAEVLQVISSSVADTAPVFEKILDSCQHLFSSEQICSSFSSATTSACLRMAAYSGNDRDGLRTHLPVRCRASPPSRRYGTPRVAHRRRAGRRRLRRPASLRRAVERGQLLGSLVRRCSGRGTGRRHDLHHAQPAGPFSAKRNSRC